MERSGTSICKNTSSVNREAVKNRTISVANYFGLLRSYLSTQLVECEVLAIVFHRELLVPVLTCTSITKKSG